MIFNGKNYEVTPEQRAQVSVRLNRIDNARGMVSLAADKLRDARRELREEEIALTRLLSEIFEGRGPQILHFDDENG